MIAAKNNSRAGKFFSSSASPSRDFYFLQAEILKFITVEIL